MGDVVVVAWDMPFVTSALLGALIEAANATRADAVVPDSNSPSGVEPFCAFYSARVRTRLSTFLSGPGGPAHAFVRSIPNLHRVPIEDVRRFGDPETLFLSVNTPDELARARALAGDSE